MEPVITFYDIPSKLPNSTWGPNTYKTRYALDFKGVPYKTEWVEYPDIADVCKKIGAAPTSKRPDGSDHYTCPVIHDSETGKCVSDSWNIAIYLDEKYPEKPRLIPKGYVGLMKVFAERFEENIPGSWIPFNMPQSANVLSPRSEEYFRRTRGAKLGNLKDLLPVEGKEEKWELVRKSFDWLERIHKLNEGDGFKGGFLVGDSMTYADVLVAAWISWFKVWGVDSKEWKDIMALNDGRAEKMLSKLAKVY